VNALFVTAWILVAVILAHVILGLFLDERNERRSRKPPPRWRIKVQEIYCGVVFYEVQKRGNFAWTTYGDTLTKKEAEAALQELESGGEK